MLHPLMKPAGWIPWGYSRTERLLAEIHLAQGKLAVLKLEEVFLMQRQKNMNKVYLEEMEFPPAVIIVKDPILVQLRQRTVCFWPLLALVYLNWGTAADSLQYLSYVCT